MLHVALIHLDFNALTSALSHMVSFMRAITSGASGIAIGG